MILKQNIKSWKLVYMKRNKRLPVVSAFTNVEALVTRWWDGDIDGPTD